MNKLQTTKEESALEKEIGSGEWVDSPAMRGVNGFKEIVRLLKTWKSQ